MTGGTSVHAINEHERSAFVRFIRQQFSAEDDGGSSSSSSVPFALDESNLDRIIADGILLPKLIARVFPSVLSESAIHGDYRRDPKASVFLRLENHRTALEAARQIGCKTVNVSAEDLNASQEKPYLAFGLLWQVIKRALLNRITVAEHPELLRIVLPEENIRDIPPEALLLRWCHFHLAKEKFPHKVRDFSGDWSDGRAYLFLLRSLQPQFAAEIDNVLRVMDAGVRTDKFLELVSRVMRPHEILVSRASIREGNEKLNLAFLAALFHSQSGMAPLHEELEGINDHLSAQLSRLELERKQQLDARDQVNFGLRRELKARELAVQQLQAEVAAQRAAFAALTRENEALLSRQADTAYKLKDALRELARQRDELAGTNEAAEGLSEEISGLKSKAEKTSYLIEHLKNERERSEFHMQRLRLFYNSCPTVEELCKTLFGDIRVRDLLPRAGKTGFLTKKARSGSNWSLRFFILVENFLLYYKSSDPGAQPAGILRIDDANLKFADNPTKADLGNQWLLCIEVPNAYKKDSGMFCFYVAGPDSELEGWKEEIRKAIGWWTRKGSVRDYQKKAETSA